MELFSTVVWSGFTKWDLRLGLDTSRHLADTLEKTSDDLKETLEDDWIFQR